MTPPGTEADSLRTKSEPLRNSSMEAGRTVAASSGYPNAVGMGVVLCCYIPLTMVEVFLSSTARDLSECRTGVYRAIEGLAGYHCVRMEDFGAWDTMPDEL